MANVSIPTTVVETKNGECKVHITLELNINLNGNVATVESVKNLTPVKEDKVEWVIPEFDSRIKLDFGKKE